MGKAEISTKVSKTKEAEKKKCDALVASSIDFYDAQTRDEAAEPRHEPL